MAELSERYTLLEHIGDGGVASVWRARDEKVGQEVAIKRLHPHLARDPVARERLRREVLAARRIGGDGVLGIHDFVTEEEEVFLVQDLAEEDLAARLAGEGPLPLEEGLALGARVARTLHRAHQAGVLHRDIKPANLLLSKGDGPLPSRVMLADFGLARLEELAGATATAALAGSVGYTAPEVYAGVLDDPRSDQYALAATLQELLTGQLPFGNLPAAEALRRQLSEDPPVAALPAPVASVLGRALRRAPEARFPTLEAFADSLEAAGRGEAPAEILSLKLCKACGAALVPGLGVCPGCGRPSASIPRGVGPYQVRVYAPAFRFRLSSNNNMDTLTFAEKQTIVSVSTEATGAPLKEAMQVDAALRRPIVIAADGLDQKGAEILAQRYREAGLKADPLGPGLPGPRGRELFYKIFPFFPMIFGLLPTLGILIGSTAEKGPPAPVALLPLTITFFASLLLRYLTRPQLILAPGGSSGASASAFPLPLEEGMAKLGSAAARQLLAEVYRAAGSLRGALAEAPEAARQEGTAAVWDACQAALDLARKLDLLEQAQPTPATAAALRRLSLRAAKGDLQAQSDLASAQQREEESRLREEGMVRLRAALLDLAADLRAATTRIAAHPGTEAEEAVERLQSVARALGGGKELVRRGETRERGETLGSGDKARRMGQRGRE